MAYEGWYTCDVCDGDRVSRDDKEALRSWVDVSIETYHHWEKDAKPYLDLEVCSLKCAIEGIRAWLNDQDTKEATV